MYVYLYMEWNEMCIIRSTMMININSVWWTFTPDVFYPSITWLQIFIDLSLSYIVVISKICVKLRENSSS